MAAQPRWLSCLGREGSVLAPCGDGRFGVYPGADRRRRPLVRIDGLQVRQALSAGLLVEEGRALVLGEAGRAALRRGAGDDHAAQHREMIDAHILSGGGRVQAVRRNRREGALGRWADHLEEIERAAGERFCADYARSSLHQHTTRNWSLTASARTKGWRGEAACLGAIAAKERVMKALAALDGGMAQLVTAVCIREESMAAIERRFGWAQRSGKTVLKLALLQLARHYGMGG